MGRWSSYLIWSVLLSQILHIGTLNILNISVHGLHKSYVISAVIKMDFQGLIHSHPHAAPMHLDAQFLNAMNIFKKFEKTKSHHLFPLQCVE